MVSTLLGRMSKQLGIWLSTSFKVSSSIWRYVLRITNIKQLALNAKETLSVGQTIVLHLFHLMQIAVNPLLVRKYYGFN